MTATDDLRTLLTAALLEVMAPGRERNAEDAKHPLTHELYLWAPSPLGTPNGRGAKPANVGQVVDAITTALAGRVVITPPSVPHPGPRTDADFYRTAAWNLRHGYAVGGSNVTATVSTLLDTVATALDGADPREDDDTRRFTRGRPNDAAERFAEEDLAEKLIDAVEGDSLALDGAEWWVEEDRLDPADFVMTDDESGECYRVTLLAEIRKVHPAVAGRGVETVDVQGGVL